MASSDQQSEKAQPVMIVAIDESEHSAYALKWTLDHFFNNNNPVFKLVLLHARPSATSSVGLAGPGICNPNSFSISFIVVVIDVFVIE